MRPLYVWAGLGLIAGAGLGAGCGDDGGLSDYYPPLPPATGAPQQAFAGRIADASELLTGPAQSGLVGDYVLRNDRVAFVIQSPARALGVIPQGGNIVDAALTDGTAQTVADHFGELGLFYVYGRTCEPTEIEVVRDGAAGGVAVLRAIGKTGNDDFINIKAIGPLRVDPEVDPVNDDRVDCATTYILAPGATSVEVHHSLYNDGDALVQGPLGTLADSGGNTEAWTSVAGFQRADIDALITSSAPQPADYVLYQAPGVAYGVIPRPAVPGPNAHALIAGVSVFLTGQASLLDVLRKENWVLQLQPGKGLLQSYELAVGRDAADIDAAFRGGLGEALRPVSGRVTFASGAAAAGARVGVFVDGNGNGAVDAPDVDRIVTYLDAAADGTYAGNVATTLGPLLVRAEVKDLGRSPAQPLGEGVSLAIPTPIAIDYRVEDALTGTPVPGTLIVIGDHAAFPDTRVFETYDRIDGIVARVFATRGTTAGADADPQLLLPAGTYRIYASRGPEWSMASQPVGPGDGSLTFRLREVNPTPGYVGSDWHVHQVGSPDSNVLSEERIASAVAAGLELFAVTDHDYVSDLQPIVERMGLAQRVRVIPGLEVTPFAYGHFNCWPLVPDETSANRGAIDWARGAEPGFAMVPGEIYDAMRERGARMVQVNHPRGSGFSEFQAAFSRANVTYDFDERTIYGDFENASTPHEDLRLPEGSLWSDGFNGLEVWNGFSVADSNDDGLRELTSLDRVMRDWFSMLSLGMVVTPAGNSDTHTRSDPVGMPRTYVRVPDDSSAALASGALVEPVLATQTGAGPRDLVVTNGPMLTVTRAGQPALGRTLTPDGTGAVTLTVTITSPDWAELDTLEVFANTAPPALPNNNAETTLVPLHCWTTRTNLPAQDPCRRAPMVASPLAITLAAVPGPGNARRYEATVTVTLDALDIVNRPGATGTDAWLVFRVRGNRAIFPVYPSGSISPATSAALLDGSFDLLRTALTNQGVPASAFTSPVFLDFDGGGYRAPFAP